MKCLVNCDDSLDFNNNLIDYSDYSGNNNINTYTLINLTPNNNKEAYKRKRIFINAYWLCLPSQYSSLISSPTSLPHLVLPQLKQKQQLPSQTMKLSNMYENNQNGNNIIKKKLYRNNINNSNCDIKGIINCKRKYTNSIGYSSIDSEDDEDNSINNIYNHKIKKILFIYGKESGLNKHQFSLLNQRPLFDYENKTFLELLEYI
uniref:Uncharacterized protein n=1 Tax=Trachysalambria curvirostris majanivirus TaxID=2984281 RepID=A0A9C7CE57_9VIRU|nr:MAG: hypothetical protein [Trachysalambria curvirostris majanivirus]